MPKSYYRIGNFIIPFSNILCVTSSSTSTKFELDIHTESKTLGVFESNADDFLSQYTAWLDSQSTPQL